MYVRATSNYGPGLPLETFDRLGPEWSGESLPLPFGEGEDLRILQVVGWSDRNGGQPCPIKVVRVRWRPTKPVGAEMAGILVWGGNSGLRILDPEAEPVPGIDDHLPPGYGTPFVWIEDAGNLPAEVRAVVGDHPSTL